MDPKSNNQSNEPTDKSMDPKSNNQSKEPTLQVRADIFTGRLEITPQSDKGRNRLPLLDDAVNILTHQGQIHRLGHQQIAQRQQLIKQPHHQVHPRRPHTLPVLIHVANQNHHAVGGIGQLLESVENFPMKSKPNLQKNILLIQSVHGSLD